MKRAHGYSLLELLIAVSIIGMLTAMLTKLYLDYLDRKNAEQLAVQVSRVVSALQAKYWHEGPGFVSVTPGGGGGAVDGSNFNFLKLGVAADPKACRDSGGTIIGTSTISYLPCTVINGVMPFGTELSITADLAGGTITLTPIEVDNRIDHSLSVLTKKGIERIFTGMVFSDPGGGLVQENYPLFATPSYDITTGVISIDVSPIAPAENPHLLRNGSNAMTGDLDVGGNSINNVDTLSVQNLSAARLTGTLDANGNNINDANQITATGDIRTQSDLVGDQVLWADPLNPTSALTNDQGGSIELGYYGGNSGSGTPYIDFHFNGSNSDYNVRLVNDIDGVLTARGEILRSTGNLVVDGTDDPLGDRGNIQATGTIFSLSEGSIGLVGHVSSLGNFTKSFCPDYEYEQGGVIQTGSSVAKPFISVSKVARGASAKSISSFESYARDCDAGECSGAANISNTWQIVIRVLDEDGWHDVPAGYGEALVWSKCIPQ